MLLVFQALLTGLAVLISNAYGLVEGATPAANFHPFTLQTCTASPDGRGNCDPVNLIFPAKTWSQVRDTLRAQGWSTAGYGSTQSMQFGSDVVVEDEQLFLADSPDSRYHVRLWQGPGFVTYASVHHERDNLQSLTHTVDGDWEDAEAFVASSLCPLARACATAEVPEQDRIQGGDGEWRGRENDGTLTVIVLR